MHRTFVHSFFFFFLFFLLSIFFIVCWPTSEKRMCCQKQKIQVIIGWVFVQKFTLFWQAISLLFFYQERHVFYRTNRKTLALPKWPCNSVFAKLRRWDAMPQTWLLFLSLLVACKQCWALTLALCTSVISSVKKRYGHKVHLNLWLATVVQYSG